MHKHLPQMNTSVSAVVLSLMWDCFDMDPVYCVYVDSSTCGQFISVQAESANRSQLSSVVFMHSA